ncbi:alpha/beta hydrolase [Streptomyces albidoflavus]|uniref:alpha/beta hydrolase n=1 Tax=Streptomyces albidoflavus TaxID=1886 RepID=UPI0021498192|nr:alpha/beta fold hydrolase [Streptomyces albidoflavus]MCR0988452.1 alpha/beta fold hydrolase [Streptomyces albidoflavus]
MVLLAADGVAIEAVYEPADFDADVTRDAAGRVPVTVVAHGFTGSVGRPHVRRAAAVFRRYGAVITFSFRGHGASGGRSTVGDREVLDLAAAVAWARRLGHRTVWTVGFSMGGSVVLRHAALYPAGAPDGHGSAHDDVHGSGHDDAHGPAHTDAVVAVSAPARWYYRGTAAMRRLHWVVTRPLGRAVGRYGLRTRIHTSDWDPVPLDPAEAAARIAPTPLLLVHGDRDPYFPLDHPRALATAAGSHADLWLEPGMGHAENAADEALLARIGAWAARRAPGG